MEASNVDQLWALIFRMAHNALIDALATAELFLAQTAELGEPRLGALQAPL